MWLFTGRTKSSLYTYMLVPSEQDKPMFGLLGTFIFHYLCRTPAQVKMPTAETLWQEKADWDHGKRAMVSIKLYRSHTKKSDKGQSDEICFWNQVGFMKEAEAVSRKRKKLQQPWNMLGEYKTENYSKPLMDLFWACAPYCLILEQKFIHGQDKHWQLLRHILSLLWHNGQWEKSCLEQLHQVFLSLI